MKNYLLTSGHSGRKKIEPLQLLQMSLLRLSFNTIAGYIYEHYDEILNYFVNRSTNAFAESFNAKIKAFRAQLRGVTDLKFFFYRLTKLFA